MFHRKGERTKMPFLTSKITPCLSTNASPLLLSQQTLPHRRSVHSPLALVAALGPSRLAAARRMHRSPRRCSQEATPFNMSRSPLLRRQRPSCTVRVLTLLNRSPFSITGEKVDLDLGNYDQFLDVKLTRDHNITTGKIYQERMRDYLRKQFRLSIM